jgi:hypothetical protein
MNEHAPAATSWDRISTRDAEGLPGRALTEPC